MPIYAYKCSACGFEKDVLQKMSDPKLTECPSCGQQTFSKQLTAAGFQLKGSGWYVTDFRNGNKPAATAAAKSDGSAEPAAAKPAGTDAAGTAAPAASSSSSDAGASSSSTATPAAPAAPATPAPKSA
jgi:putative FmdB family regulatory protein